MARLPTQTLALVALVSLASLAGTPPAAAQDFELSPFAGFRGGGELSEQATNRSASLDGSAAFGLAAAWKAKGQGRFVEAFWSRQETETHLPGADRTVDVAIDLVQVGGSYRWIGKSLEPFVSATVGAALIAGEEGGREAVAAGSLGAGFRWVLSPRLALRVDGRGYALFEVESVTIACGPGCAAGLAAGGTTQGELTLALSAGF